MMGRSNRRRGVNKGMVFFLQQRDGEFEKGRYRNGADYIKSWRDSLFETTNAKIALI